VFANPQLIRLNWGIFVLHSGTDGAVHCRAVRVRNAGLALGEHWKIYLR
jgi:hypothetical protein